MNSSGSRPAEQEWAAEKRLGKAAPGAGQVRRALALACLVQLLAEWKAGQLMLWPLDHSCAPALNLTRAEYQLAAEEAGPRRAPGGPRPSAAFQTALQLSLFDVSPEERPALARAWARGIAYDDIAHCYQHRVDRSASGEPVVDTEDIEPCRHGLRFERRQPDVSALAHYRLACARQWLKMLLPQSLAAGLLAGLLAGRLLRRAPPQRAGGRFRPAAELGLAAALLLALLHSHLNVRAHFGYLVACVGVRSFLLGAGMARTLLPAQRQGAAAGHCDSSPGAESGGGRNRGIWRNSATAANKCHYFLALAALHTLAQALFDLAALRLLTSWLQVNQWLSITGGALAGLVALHQSLGNRRKRLASAPPGDASRQEACLAPEPEARGAGDLCEFCQVPGGLLELGEPAAPGAAYQPTTAPGLVCGLEPFGGPRPAPAAGFLRQHLFGGPLAWRLRALLFCACLNHFLLHFLPNHALLHTESLASRYARKILYRQAHPLPPAQPAGQVLPAPDPADSFDYSSHSHASRALNTMSHSYNPLLILWTSLELNYWPCDLLIILLHLSAISNFGAVYFKLNRLLSLVKRCAQALAIEWAIVGIIRRQNHLFEVQFLHSAGMLVAHSCASLLLYNYLHTILKMSARLGMGHLIGLVAGAAGACGALVIASTAPELEKLDLAVIPSILLLNNLLIWYVAQDLAARFRGLLCHRLFDEQHSS